MRQKITALTAILIASLALTHHASAQEMRTTYFMQTSDLRHEMNPALLDHAYVSMPLIGNINVGTTGNFGAKTFIFDMQPTWQGYGVDGHTRTTFMHPDVSADEFLGGLKKNNRLSLNIKYQVFSFAFKAFGGINSVEANLRSNTSVNLPKSLFEFMKTAGEKTDYDISDLGARSESFAEVGLGHAHKIGEKWTVGAKIKILMGIAYANANTDKVHLHLDEDYWRITGNVSAEVAMNGLKLKESEKADPENPDRHEIDDVDIEFQGINNLGAFFDLGTTWKPIDHLTLSASVTDLGFIKWKESQLMSSTSEWTFDGFDEDIYAGGDKDNSASLDDQLENLGDDLEEIFTLYYDGAKKNSHALAANIHLGAEYALPVYDRLRFGFLYTSRLAGAHSWHQGMLSINIRPAKWFELSLSGSAASSGVSGGMVIDLHAKRFNLSLGTDCFVSKMDKNGIPLQKANNSVYFGISYPLSNI
ncbi:MAG: DUF5723 family protein [Bacteroidaceae bacterium]